MDDERTEAEAAAGGADADPAGTEAEAAAGADTDAGGAEAEGAGAEAEAHAIEAESEAAIVDLPWDEDLPVALGDDSEAAEDAPGPVAEDALDDADPDGPDPDLDADELLAAYDEAATARRNALPRRVESWRTRSASGAIATAIAMGLQQVFEPERRRPAAVAEAPSDPYNDDDPVTVDYVPDDAESTRVHVKPWLLQKGDPT